jgi:deoxyhypusine synthase
VQYREADLSRLTTIPVAGRQNKVDQRLLASPPGSDRSLSAFLDSLPDILAAHDLRQIIKAVAGARRDRRGVILLLGGHVVKVGLGPLINAWLAHGIVTHVAMNGAAAIHDFELAAFGGTSEDVEAGLADGSFGMAEETGAEMNAAIAAAARADQGMGEGLSRALAKRRKTLPGAEASILLAAQEHDVPVTVHAAIGAEIIHQHPTADGAAVGATSHRDFRRLAAAIPDLHQGGVVLNWGSAVLMPEVFLKALTIARNLEAGRPTHFTAADFDMQRHYRPRVNVVQRPTRAGGSGFLLTGHHEILLPLLVWGVLEAVEKSEGSKV